MNDQSMNAKERESKLRSYTSCKVCMRILRVGTKDFYAASLYECFRILSHCKYSSKSFAPIQFFSQPKYFMPFMKRLAIFP